LGISGADLQRIVQKAGNSIAAISKEVELEKQQSTAKSPAS
jgi:hypothetical protein